MSVIQNHAINEMWRQGLHAHANRAERCWGRGQEFSLDTSIAVPRIVRQAIDQANREVAG